MRSTAVWFADVALAVLALMILVQFGGGDAGAAEPKEPYDVPVVVVKFFPIKDGRIDSEITGGYNQPLDEIRKWTDHITDTTIYAMEEGSRYHAYKDAFAQPSLDYKVLKTYEFLEPTPKTAKNMPDCHAIMKKINGKDWVENKGVKEVWLFSYHSGVMGLWESNMSGPWGDISNSDRDATDSPVYKNTYTIYTYNYGRGPAEAMENHIHQIEHVLNYIDGRDRTPENKWGDLLFWGKFVGSDISHKMIPTKDGVYRCGWGHYPPNAEADYDWGNKRAVTTDIEDWKPEGGGKTRTITSADWGGDSYKWFIYWMQSIPGRNHGLTYKGKKLTNWWVFVGDFDHAMKNKVNLVEK